MKPITLILFAIFIPALSQADEYFEMDKNPFYQQLDAYARAFNLEQLRSSNQNELRLWYFNPMGGEISSLIFREKGAFRCETKSKYSASNTEVIVKSGKCKKSKNKLSKSEIENKLSRLIELKEKETSCNNIDDGWGVTIEGVLNNERFAFESWNPDGCDNMDAVKLYEILESIEI